MKNKAKVYESSQIKTLLEKRDPLKTQQSKIKMGLSARLEDILIELGWGKKDLAGKMGKSPSMVTRWLSGTHNFTIDTITEIEFVTGKLLNTKKQSKIITVQGSLKMDAVINKEEIPVFTSPSIAEEKKVFYYKSTTNNQD